MQPSLLSDHALAIWQAGVEAVTPQRLFADKVRLHGTLLEIEEVEIDLRHVRRLVVVGAGKASAAMAGALSDQILAQLPGGLAQLDVRGWINCVAGTFDGQLPQIHLHAARGPGSNSPTERGVEGTSHILQMIGDCDERDVVLCLLSGGGSALLVAPPKGITLADKQELATVIAAAGGNIHQLNTVRRAVSEVKGGGLARASRAGRLVTLIISDVLGDSLADIASGPTLLGADNSPAAALAVLQELDIIDHPRLQSVVDFLRSRPRATAKPGAVTSMIEHVILGNNADAVDAAGVKAVELGYRYVLQAARQPEGDVALVSEAATAAVKQIMTQREVDCWISGGEPTVSLPTRNCGLGGRNQHLALAVLHQLDRWGWPSRGDIREFAFVSGGTDGEDGPTDAAGAWFDRDTWQRMRQLELNAQDYLARADAYHFFEQLAGLIRCGPTGTNVCDLRVGLAGTVPGNAGPR